MANHIPNQEHDELLLDRPALARRWAVSIETIKRRERDGSLKATYLPGGRLVRYRLADVIAAEGGKYADPVSTGRPVITVRKNASAL
jgi:hypothetical protein